MASYNRYNDEDKVLLRHYPSTSYLDRYKTAPNFKVNGNKSTVLLNASSSNLDLLSQSYMPKTTLSTFASHKSGTDLRYKDDPSPYKVSDIDKYRIKVRDPFVSNRSQQVLTLHSDELGSPYSVGSPEAGRERMFDRAEEECNENDIYPSRVERSQTLKSTSGSHKSYSSRGRSSRVSGSVSMSSDGIEGEEFSIPEPDYEESTGGSEDLALPLPESSCSEEYSSVSAGSDPDHYALRETVGPSPSPDGQQDRKGADSGLDTPVVKITNADKGKIEHALKGRKTTVFVADSLANLYVMKRPALGSRLLGNGNSDDWALKYTGVPVLLLDSGETKCRDKRRIQIVLAELGSGLALWKDVIDNLTSYKVMEGSNTFHSFHYSQDHSKIIGLSFDDEESAINFSERVSKLTSDFQNINLSGAKTKGKNRKDSKAAKVKPAKFVKPKKSEISQPCAFVHISSLSSSDKGRLSSLQNFIVNNDLDSVSEASETFVGQRAHSTIPLSSKVSSLNSCNVSEISY